MSMIGDIETFHAAGKWHNRMVDGEYLPGSYDSRTDAFEVASIMASMLGVDATVVTSSAA